MIPFFARRLLPLILKRVLSQVFLSNTVSTHISSNYTRFDVTGVNKIAEAVINHRKNAGPAAKTCLVCICLFSFNKSS